MSPVFKGLVCQKFGLPQERRIGSAHGRRTLSPQNDLNEAEFRREVRGSRSSQVPPRQPEWEPRPAGTRQRPARYPPARFAEACIAGRRDGRQDSSARRGQGKRRRDDDDPTVVLSGRNRHTSRDKPPDAADGTRDRSRRDEPSPGSPLGRRTAPPRQPSATSHGVGDEAYRVPGRD